MLTSFQTYLKCPSLDRNKYRTVSAFKSYVPDVTVVAPQNRESIVLMYCRNKQELWA